MDVVKSANSTMVRCSGASADRTFEIPTPPGISHSQQADDISQHDMSLRRPSLLLCRTAIQALAAAEACTSAAAHGAGRVIQEAWSCPPFALFGSAATARPLVSLADFQPCSGRQRQGSQPLPHQPLRTSFTATPAAAQSTGATHPAQTLAYLQHSCLPASATLQSSQQRPFARQASVDADDARRRHAGKPAAEAENPSSQDAAHSPSGWTRREVWNAPNAISMARLLSGPIIASWIVAGKTDAALLGLVISGGGIFHLCALDKMHDAAIHIHPVLAT